MRGEEFKVLREPELLVEGPERWLRCRERGAVDKLGQHRAHPRVQHRL